MVTVKLLSFQAETEIAAKARSLRRRGLTVDATPLVSTSAAIGELARLDPAVLVLDLDRLPSHARAIAESVRNSKSARHIPLLFVGGEAEKVERVRAENPNATHASWAEAPKALTRLLAPASRPRAVATPRILPNYSATPLPRKLGVIVAKDSPRQVALLAAPDGFLETLGDLPQTVTFSPSLTAKTALALCFVRTAIELEATVEMLAARLPQGASAWIIYPKKHHKPGFNENHVRDAGLARDLVDYKVCSIDDHWSGLKFARRKR